MRRDTRSTESGTGGSIYGAGIETRAPGTFIGPATRSGSIPVEHLRNALFDLQLRLCDGAGAAGTESWVAAFSFHFVIYCLLASLSLLS